VYSEIASNKRRSVIVIVIVAFFVIWLAIGAACGFLFKAIRGCTTTGLRVCPRANPLGGSEWSRSQVRARIRRTGTAAPSGTQA